MSEMVTGTLLLEEGELALLLAGNDIFGLRLPGGLASSVRGGKDVSGRFVTLYRDGLLCDGPAVADGAASALDYAPMLRAVLVGLRTARCIWEYSWADAPDEPLFMAFATPETPAVLVGYDSLRKGWLRVQVLDLHDACAELCISAKAFADESLVLEYPQLLIRGALYPRDAEKPLSTLMIERVEQDAIVVRLMGQGEPAWQPLQAESLAGLLEKASIT